MARADSFGSAEEKSRYVRRMFNGISRRYDFLNHFLSAGIDRRWRRRAIRASRLTAGESILDVACGTGDVSLEAAKARPDKIVAVDFAEGMLRGFDQKRKKLGLNGGVEIIQADAERLPFPDSTFDVTAVAFGVRNFGNLERGVVEMRRVLKPEGRLVVLEFSKPHRFPFRQIYFFYFKRVLPLIGRTVSGDPGAYSYLPGSVTIFPDGEEFAEILRRSGFRDVILDKLTFGIATIYIGVK